MYQFRYIILTYAIKSYSFCTLFDFIMGTNATKITVNKHTKNLLLDTLQIYLNKKGVNKKDKDLLENTIECINNDPTFTFKDGIILVWKSNKSIKNMNAPIGKMFEYHFIFLLSDGTVNIRIFGNN